MPREEDRIRLQHMLDSANEAIQFMSGRTYYDFSQNRMLQQAVLRSIEIIGEASANITEEYRHAHDDIPWGDIIGMRNRLIHAYFDINIKLVWKTIIEDLPDLIPKLELLL